MGENVSFVRGKIQSLQHALPISKAYLVTAMAKFPLVVSKNGIINSTLAILLIGGIISSISNFLLSRIGQKTNVKSYMGISGKEMGTKSHLFVSLMAFLFRCVVLCYSVDLSFKFLKSSSILNLNDMQLMMVLGFVLAFSTLILSNPNLYSFGRSRNIITFIVLGLLTSVFSIKNFNSNINKIKIENPSENVFDSLGLTCICFAQQLGLVEILSNDKLENEMQILCGGILASLCYISIGVAGYIAIPDTTVNWLLGIDNTIIRSIGSTILLFSNIFTFPLLVEPIRKEIMALNHISNTKSREMVFNIAISVFFCLTGIRFVASKYGVILCAIFSSFITMIFPSIFYFKAFGRRAVQPYLLLAIGLFILSIGLKSLVV